MNFVKIDNISDVMEDKNGRNYKSFSLSSGSTRNVKDENTGKVYPLKSVGKSTTVNSWEKTYLDDSKHWMYDLKVGDLLDGTIYTASVAPYIIEDEDGNTREVSTYTGFVLGFETDAGFEPRVRRMILDAGRELAEESANSSSMQVAKEHQSLNEEIEIEETIEEEFGN